MNNNALTYIVIVALILGFSCSSVFNHQNKSQGALMSQAIENSEYYLCEGDTIYIDVSKNVNPNLYYQYQNIMNCLVPSGLRGNSYSNKEIAKLISTHGYSERFIIRSNLLQGRLRGPVVFEAFINLGINDTPVYEQDNSHWTYTRTYYCFQRMEEMVQSIDGEQDVRKYIGERNSLYSRNLKTIEEVNIERDHIFFETLKKAYKEHKIILKPFDKN